MFFAATLALGLVPAAAFAVEDDGVEEPNNEDVIDVVSSEDVQEDLVADASASAAEDASIEDDAATGDDQNLSVPAAMERVNEDVTLTTRTVAQAESTRSYFLAQTLESTHTVPMVSANLSLDTSAVDGPADAEGDDQSGEEEAGDDSDESDPSAPPISSESTVVGSFTYLGMTFAIEPGGETVALMASDYAKLPVQFIENQTIAVPEAAVLDGTTPYTVTRISDDAFASLDVEESSSLVIPSASEEPVLIEQNEGEALTASRDDAQATDTSEVDPSADATGITTLAIPASITTIEPNAFSNFDTLRYIVVSPDNQNYSSFDGCLYAADQQSLLLIPEGRLGAVRIAPSVTSIDPEVFSHCPSVDTLVADADSAAFQLLSESDLHNADGMSLETIATDEAPADLPAPYTVEFSALVSVLNTVEAEITSESKNLDEDAPIFSVQTFDSRESMAATVPSGWTQIATLDASTYGNENTWGCLELDSMHGCLFTTTLGSFQSGLGVSRVTKNPGYLSASYAYDGYSTAYSSRGYRGCLTRDGVLSKTRRLDIQYSAATGFYVWFYLGELSGTYTYEEIGPASYTVSNTEILPLVKCSSVSVYKIDTPKLDEEAWSDWGWTFDDATTTGRVVDHMIVFHGDNDFVIDPNGGTYKNSSNKTTTTQAAYGFPGASLDNSRTFLGYLPSPASAVAPTEEENDFGCYSATTRYRVMADVTLTAQWGATITWDPNEGTLSSGVASTSLKPVGQTHTTPTAEECTRPGYTLEGWYEKSDFSSARIAPGAETPAESVNKTYYAKWTKKDNVAVKLVNNRESNAVVDTAWFWPDMGFVTGETSSTLADETTPAFKMAQAEGLTCSGYYSGYTQMIDAFGHFTETALTLKTVSANTSWSSRWNANGDMPVPAGWTLVQSFDADQFTGDDLDCYTLSVFGAAFTSTLQSGYNSVARDDELAHDHGQRRSFDRMRQGLCLHPLQRGGRRLGPDRMGLQLLVHHEQHLELHGRLRWRSHPHHRPCRRQDEPGHHQRRRADPGGRFCTERVFR